jgi:hypothetical protein
MQAIHFGNIYRVLGVGNAEGVMHLEGKAGTNGIDSLRGLERSKALLP